MTFIGSQITWPELDTQSKLILPTPPHICPKFNSTISPNCKVDSLYWQVFFCEFLASFVFIFSWLIIRNYEIYGDMRKWENFIKPAVVALVYKGT
jgi:glycerol uptake facilitator-like aquaporin